MKKRHILFEFRVFRTFVPVLLAGAAYNNAACAEHFASREAGFKGQVNQHVALFLPADLPLEHMPASLCLLERPKPTGQLDAGWSVVPTFSYSETRTRATIAVAPGTSLYGTGEVKGPLLRNNHAVRLWNTDNFEYRDDEGRRLYQSHPWVLGVRSDGSAFGIIVDSTWAMDLSTNDTEIAFTCDGPPFPILVMEGASPQAVITELAGLTGKMPLPPRWALGFQQCRWSYHPDAKVREIADQFRQRRIPCDVLWMDIDYMNGFRVFTFDPKEFPQPKALSEYLHARGFKSVWMIDPGVKAEPGYPVYDRGTAADVWVQNASGAPYHGSVWPGDCVFPDFTRPETRAWWSALYRDFMAQGVDGVWNDMNEPAVFAVPGKTMPLHNWHRGGGDLPAGPHAQYHNVFGMLMVQASRQGIAQANPDRRPFVLTRANFLGGQRYAATWTGDNGSTNDFFQMAVPMTLNLGLSGQPFNGPDLGGFGESATVELWANWVAVGAFFPFCRAHAQRGTPNKEPWAFGPEVEKIARGALERRYRLLPYYYTLFHESSLDGQPIMRPVFFADPRDPALRAEDRAFLVGGDVLVVPKWAIGLNLPKGVWREVSLVEGDTNDKVQPTLRVRGGAIVPLGKIVQSTVEESFDPLTLVVSLDASGHAVGQLYEDAGDGYSYQQGDFLLTSYEAVRQGNSVVVRVKHSEGKRPRPKRNVVVQILDDSGVKSGTGVDGESVAVRIE